MNDVIYIVAYLRISNGFTEMSSDTTRHTVYNNYYYDYRYTTFSCK